jgi:hypothetical protein
MGLKPLLLLLLPLLLLQQHTSQLLVACYTPRVRPVACSSATRLLQHH